jgi:hypothetical protein
MTASAIPAGPLRSPAIAGTFYPGDPAVLAHRVDELLGQAAERAAGTARVGVVAPVGLIVPHAGIAYSGAVAAAGWASLRARPPDTVIIAGTNHFAAGLRGIAVWPDGSWRTPLGDTPVDDVLAARIAALGRPFAIDRESHRDEHSIEVQLPFLARACPSSRLVPLLVSCASVQACVSAGEALGRLLAEVRAAGSSVVLVASSDFAHYPDERDARDVNRRLVPLISRLDPDAVAAEEDALRRSPIRGLSCGLCGLEPVLFALGAFRAMGLAPGQLLAEATSADVPGGDPFRTVGYATIAFEA